MILICLSLLKSAFVPIPLTVNAFQLGAMRVSLLEPAHSRIWLDNGDRVDSASCARAQETSLSTNSNTSLDGCRVLTDSTGARLSNLRFLQHRRRGTVLEGALCIVGEHHLQR